jgi:glutamate--cysteine ligase catalytic subunit
MEVQPTDFENAAYSVFIVLLTRAILSFGLNFYMPISKVRTDDRDPLRPPTPRAALLTFIALILAQVDENMARAQKRDAVTGQRFFFRKSVSRRPAPTSASARSSVPSSPTMATFSAGASALNGNGAAAASSSSANSAGAANGSTGSSGRQTRPPSPELGPIEDEYEEMTADEILNGKPGTDFVGLVGLVTAYVDSLEIDLEARCQLAIYLDLVRNRASGKLVTPAAYYRRFITSHPAYKGDSAVSPEICYDLAKEVDELERGVRRAPDFLPASYRGTGQGTQTPRSS